MQRKKAQTKIRENMYKVTQRWYVPRSSRTDAATGVDHALPWHRIFVETTACLAGAWQVLEADADLSGKRR